MTQALSSKKTADYQAVMDLADRLNLDRERVRAILGISESSQFRYEKNNPTLKPNLCDRWSRLIRVVELAEDILEDEAEVRRWLSAPKSVLNNQCPLDLLTSDAGTRQVEQILLQASYGVFA